MCLLNGDISGHLPYEVDFGKEEYRDLENDTVTYKYIPIKDIIFRAVHEFGGELAQNIIINDIDDAGLILLKYINEKPSYLYKAVDSNEYKNFILNDTTVCYYQKEGRWIPTTIADSDNIIYEPLLSGIDFIETPTPVIFDLNNQELQYTLAKIQYGDVPGYFLTDLTYSCGGTSNSNDLIAKAGESLTSVLDKIKNMLAHFEYYYDINGKFIFQKKREYITITQNNLDTTDLGYDIVMNSDNIMFNFADGILISSFQNNPKINNIKNDFSVWGSYNNSGTEIPIHMRYAIDNKPTAYKPIRPLREKIIITIKDKDKNVLSNTTTYKYYDAPEVEPYNEKYLLEITDFETEINGFKAVKIEVESEDGYTKITEIYPAFATLEYSTENYEDRRKVDWRELIYQMALDYRKCSQYDDFLYYIANANPHYPSGKTGYEQYYIDLEGFWRTLYNPNPQISYDPIQFNEAKEYAEIYGDNSIYIQNGYRKINFEDLNNISTFADLYCLSEPIGENSIKSIYPYAGSENCCLAFDYDYYIDNNGTLTQHIPEEIDDNHYKALNEISLNNIYIEDVQAFGDKENNRYYVQAEFFEENNVEEFNSRSQRKGTTKDSYSKFVDVAFNLLMENENQLLNGNYYIKDTNLLKLKEVYGGENGFYISNLIPFKNYAKDLENVLQSLNINNYEDKNKYLYLQEHAELIQKYVLDTNQYNFIELNDSTTFELNEIIKNSINFLQRVILEFQNQWQSIISEKTSCLFSIFKLLQQELLLITNFNAESIKAINEIKDIYEKFNNSLINISNNLTQVENTISIYITSQMDKLDTIKKLQDALEKALKFLNEIPESDRYENGQLQLLVKNIEIIIHILNSYEINQEFKDTLNSYNTRFQEIEDILINENLDEDERKALETEKQNIENQKQKIEIAIQEEENAFINEQKVVITQNIIEPINALKEFLYITYSEDIDSKNTKFIYDTLKNNKGIIINLKILYNNFISFLICIQDLTLLLNDNLDASSVFSIITFLRDNYKLSDPILPILWNSVKNYSNIEFQNKLLEYLKSIEGYAEFISKNTTNNFNIISSNTTQYEKIKYYKGSINYHNNFNEGDFWSLEVYNSPHTLLFWFDFIEADNNEIAKISTVSIGSRTKVINDKNVRAINYKEVPQVIFKRNTDKNFEMKSGYTYININSNAEGLFSASDKAKSAKERIEELLYIHSYGAEDITISAVPLYHLEPNHHILVRDDKSKINGEYIVNKITIPLDFKKTMSITASRAVSSII